MMGGTIFDQATREGGEGESSRNVRRERPPYNDEWEALYESHLALRDQGQFADVSGICGLPFGWPHSTRLRVDADTTFFCPLLSSSTYSPAPSTVILTFAFPSCLPKNFDSGTKSRGGSFGSTGPRSSGSASSASSLRSSSSLPFDVFRKLLAPQVMFLKSFSRPSSVVLWDRSLALCMMWVVSTDATCSSLLHTRVPRYGRARAVGHGGLVSSRSRP